MSVISILALLLQSAASPSPQTSPAVPLPQATPAPKVTGVGLKPGESMIVQPMPDGSVVMVAGHPLPADQAKEGQARLDFKIENGQAYLRVLNNAPKMLAYRAIMVMPDGSKRPTDVCSVMPNGKFGIEHWPYPIAEIVLVQFRYTEDSTPVCK